MMWVLPPSLPHPSRQSLQSPRHRIAGRCGLCGASSRDYSRLVWGPGARPSRAGHRDVSRVIGRWRARTSACLSGCRGGGSDKGDVRTPREQLRRADSGECSGWVEYSVELNAKRTPTTSNWRSGVIRSWTAARRDRGSEARSLRASSGENVI